MGHGCQQCHKRSKLAGPVHASIALGQWVAPALLALLLSFQAAAPCTAQPNVQPLCYWGDGTCSLNATVYAQTQTSSNQRLHQQLAELHQKSWRCIADGSATQPGSAVWQQACAVYQAEHCVTAQAADGGPTFCVARDMPDGLLELLLGPRACALSGASASKPQQEWTPTYVASSVWWRTCDMVKASDIAQVLAAEPASGSGGWPDDEQALLAALTELESSRKWCTARTSQGACAAGGMLPYMPALNTSCGSETLQQFDDCCSNQDRVDLSNQNLSGWLPDRFMPAYGFTDLSNNPALCGTLAFSSATATSVGSMLPAHVNLYNSNLRVDLGELGPMNGPMVARWLGDGALAHNNLYGKLSLDGSYLMCTFLRTGRLAVAGSDACKPADGSSCMCKGSLAVLLHGNSEEWAACHRNTLNVSVDSALHQAKALAQYDQHMLGVEPAFACGRGGRAYRDKIAAVVWCVTSVVIAMLGAVAYLLRSRLRQLLYEKDLPLSTVASAASVPADHWAVRFVQRWVDKFNSRRQQCTQAQAPQQEASSSGMTPKMKHKWWAKALYLASYVALHSADVLMDWVYVYNVARAGNLQVLLRLGWLLLAPYLVVQVVYAVCLLRYRACGAAAGKRQQWRQHPWRPVTAFLLIVEAVIAVSLPAVVTSRLLRFASSSGYISQSDCVRTAWLFVACAVFSQLVLFFVGLLWKARSYLANNAGPYQTCSARGGDQDGRHACAVDSLAVLGTYCSCCSKTCRS
ncbi:hypothetical protein COO60DRAFT_1018464 [Scenedesmus sp. NREL 46B-D3]|nr:hypothetical protein COO60DRAFT_1018464 [Scenedesmus sp. NREL 46B-D3]